MNESKSTWLAYVRLRYHSKCRDFILESFQRRMRKFICPGRAGPVFRLDLYNSIFINYVSKAINGSSKWTDAGVNWDNVFSVRESLIYGTGYRLLWWRLPPLTLSRRDWMIGMMWNYKLLLTSTTTTSTSTSKLNHSWSFLYEDTSAPNVPIYHCNVSAPHLLPI